MHETDVLFEVALAIVVATGLALLAKWLRQPPILGYLAAGMLLGPTEGLGCISPAVIEPVAELGLILLLFMIGLEIDLKKLKSAGLAVIGAGLVQFPLCVGLGLLLLPYLGLGASETGSRVALYAAVGAALSSTMVVVKLLYDKRELDTLSGRITLGVLVFQDIWAILFLSLQPNLQDPSVVPLAFAAAKGVGLVVLALVMCRFVLPVVFRSVAKVPELMVLGSIAWCFVVALIAKGLGLSLEMGALIAGVAASTFPYNLDVVAKVVSLRDFFVTLFFVSLGARIPQPTVEMALMAVGLSVFVLASRVVSLTPLLYACRMGTRASVLPALNLAQVSEFSLVIGSIGLAMGHVDERSLAALVWAFVLTAVASTYVIQHNHAIFAAIDPLLVRIGLRHGRTGRDEDAVLAAKPIVFVGFHRHASSLLHELLRRDAATCERINVIDFNPDVKRELDRRGIANIHGDIGHADTLHHANVHGASVLACTLPNSVLRGTTNAKLLRNLRRLAPHARVIVTAETMDEARDLYERGAAYVILPRLAGVADLADAVIEAQERDPAARRLAAQSELEGRAEVMA